MKKPVKTVKAIRPVYAHYNEFTEDICTVLQEIERDGLTFSLIRSSNGKYWEVVENQTGFGCGTGETKKVALESLEKRFEQVGMDVFRLAIERTMESLKNGTYKIVGRKD